MNDSFRTLCQCISNKHIQLIAYVQQQIDVAEHKLLQSAGILNGKHQIMNLNLKMCSLINKTNKFEILIDLRWIFLKMIARSFGVIDKSQKASGSQSVHSNVNVKWVIYFEFVDVSHLLEAKIKTINEKCPPQMMTDSSSRISRNSNLQGKIH